MGKSENLKQWLAKLDCEEELNEIFRNLVILSSEQGKKIVPKREDVFKAFDLTSIDDVKVVILGQDPYPQIINKVPVAHGLAFSSNVEQFRPKSLENIFKEIEDSVFDGFDLNIVSRSVNLEDWARQGVLLLNTSLTTFVNEPGAHIHLWKKFTLRVIEYLNEYRSGLIFCLWGNHAKGYAKYINKDSHYILESGHPSPLSANKGYWFGNKHFKELNTILEKLNGKESCINYY